MGQLAILKMAAIWTRIVFRQTHLETARNSYARFRLNSSSSFGDAITVKLKDGCRRPYLSTDQKKHFLVDTTKPLGEHLRQVSKKSDQWSRRQCNEKQFADGPLWDKLYLLVELKIYFSVFLTVCKMKICYFHRRRNQNIVPIG